jgi:TusA-related sulfurtransferase
MTATHSLDTTGSAYPECILQIASKAAFMKQGDILEVVGDCQDFEKNVRTWCVETGRGFLSIKDEGEDKKRIQIQF